MVKAMDIVKIILFLFSVLTFFGGYYICHILNYKNKKAEICQKKIAPPIRHKSGKLTLNKRLILKDIQRRNMPYRTADEIMAEMNERSRAILNGETPPTKSTMITNCY